MTARLGVSLAAVAAVWIVVPPLGLVLFLIVAGVKAWRVGRAEESEPELRSFQHEPRLPALGGSRKRGHR